MTGEHRFLRTAVMMLAASLAPAAIVFAARPPSRHSSSPHSSGARSSGTRSLADTTQRTESRQPTPPTETNRETETAALKLVQDHLPELKGVLQRLRADEPRQYNRAINDLARSAKKLEVAKNRDVALFEIEAETLKAQNAVSLLTAKLKVRDNQADRQSLRHAALRLQVAQIARAQYDVESLQARLQRAKQQLESAQQRLDARREELDRDSEKSYIAALKKAGRQPDSDSADKPAGAPSLIKKPTGNNKQTD